MVKHNVLRWALFVMLVTGIVMEELETRLNELEPWLERQIALVCRTDKRSAKAAQLLGQMGFANVHVVAGGMTACNRNG